MMQNMLDDSSVLVTLIFAAIVYYNSCRNRHKLARPALLIPKHSPWQHLLTFGDDISFLDITGFSRDSWATVSQPIWPLGKTAWMIFKSISLL